MNAGNPAPGASQMTLAEALRQAMALHRAGRLPDAERLYRAILRAVPDQFDALHLLGVLEADRGNLDAGWPLLARALEVDPSSLPAQANAANVLNRMRRHAEALAASERVLAARPDDADTHNTRALALRGLARHDESLASFDRAVACNPRHAVAWTNRGLALASLGRDDEALASHTHALAIDERFAQAWHNRATTLAHQKRSDEAIAAFDRALELDPALAEAWSGRGNVLRALGRHAEALRDVDRALARMPDFAEALYVRGNVLRESGRYDDALASFTRALAARPDFAPAYAMRGYTLHYRDRNDEAAEDFARAVALDPGDAFAQGMLLLLRMYQCDWRERDSLLQAMVASVRDERPVEPFVFAVLSDSAADQLRCATTAARRTASSVPAPLWRGERYAHERIRVAYLSSDYREHATSYLMAELFELHDRSRFEVAAVSWRPDDGSGIRARIAAAAEQFIDVSERSDGEVAVLLREREVDIAVDLKGYTFDARLGILSRRPAPVQVSYLGYPGTLGAAYVDYLMADETVIPEEAKRHYAEQVVWLPDSYQVNDRKRAIGATPRRAAVGLPEGGVVFCSFNNNYKITPEVWQVWMRLLREVAGSVLWLLEGNAAAPVNLRREAAARGVSGERLVFAPRVGLAEHLARQRCADLFLDTLPCNAHTTASDALWAGLPVVTCLGRTFAGRVAGSLLRAVGLPELVTGTLEEYEAVALKLAREPESLAAVKGKLAANRLTQPLFDSERFCRQLESAYETMWARAQRGEPPQAFAVPPAA
ncbi:MAG: tetratricopeptide repeat protein [Burkholderiales bacterium]